MAKVAQKILQLKIVKTLKKCHRLIRKYCENFCEIKVCSFIDGTSDVTDFYMYLSLKSNKLSVVRSNH